MEQIQETPFVPGEAKKAEEAYFIHPDDTMALLEVLILEDEDEEELPF